MAKIKKSFLKENYSLSWKYIKDSKNFIYASIIIFLFFVFLGAFAPIPGSLENALLDLINELLGKTDGLGWFNLTTFIFLNNLQSSFFGMLLGIVLGIYSAFIVVVNGYLIGFVSSKTVEGNGLLVLWRLIPHGIFELPAFFLSTGLGIKLGTFIFKKKPIKILREYLFNSIRVFFFFVLPLLVIAAIIEGALIFLF